MKFKNLLFEEKENIAIVKINRPEKLNALNEQTITELSEVFHHIQNQKESNS